MTDRVRDLVGVEGKGAPMGVREGQLGVERWRSEPGAGALLVDGPSTELGYSSDAGTKRDCGVGSIGVDTYSARAHGSGSDLHCALPGRG